MAQPVWTTTPGDLGLFPSGSTLNIQLKAKPVAPAYAITFKIISGSLPSGNLTLSSNGLISGTTEDLGAQQQYSFTVRITDNNGNIKDGVFTITISANKIVKFLPIPGDFADIMDSEYFSKKIQIFNPVDSNDLMVRVSSGKLPPGLNMDINGVISGWPKPPTLADKSPTTKTYTFGVTVDSNLGSDLGLFSITVRNKQSQSLLTKRNPAILNNKPLTALDQQDPYYGYYIEANTLPIADAGENYSFKVIGHDFDKEAIVYFFSKLPPGLTGDSRTGWITGVPDIGTNVYEAYTFTVYAYKSYDMNIHSNVEKFVLPVRTSSVQSISWDVDSDLGTYHNGTVCDLKISASSKSPITYTVTKGELPPNIKLLPTGELVGNFPFQPEISMKKKGDKSVFNFEVTASSSVHFLLNSVKSFTITIEQRFDKPVETIYFKASPNLDGRKIINSLLKNSELIPDGALYRPQDPNFGKASDIRINHQYGIVSSSLLTYLEAISKNHYRQRFVFGEMKTAIARDENGDILYEIVYSQLIDPAVNEQGVSVPQSIPWPQDIGLRYGEWYDSRTDKFTSSELAYTSFTPGYIKLLNPVSLDNMRKEIESNMKYDYDQSLLPKWMTSQQRDGSTLGLTSAWVICHTRPGYSEFIKNRIEAYWGHSLSEIDFEIDRFIIDRKMSFNWNTHLVRPNWSNLPSAYPTPEQTDKYDTIVLFNRETILPKT